MTLNDVIDLSGHFKRVDVLGVISQELSLELELSDEAMRKRRLVLARVDLFGELEEGTRVVLEVHYVEHRLRVW